MSDERQRCAEILGHDIDFALAPETGEWWAAVSIVGDPVRVRVAWVNPSSGEIKAKVACPPGVPSRWRPVIGTLVRLMDGTTPLDQLFVGRVAPEAHAIRVLGIDESRSDADAIGPEGLVVARVRATDVIACADAIGPGDEPVGRLDRSGMAELDTSGPQVSGRLGSGHGMAAGIGHGRWMDDLLIAELEVGYPILLPEWVPYGFTQSRPRIEPDLSYPFGPLAVIVTWTGDDNQRVLVRQTVAPLASPDPGGALSRPIDIAGHPGVVRGRNAFVTLVWQTDTHVFGVQVQRMEDAESVALEVARSIGGQGE